MTPTAVPAPSRAAVIAAFAAVYILWGSTYLAIRIAIDTLPPFLMAGLRFTLAGAILYAWSVLRGAPKPTRSQWLSTALVGGLLLLGGNGGLSWAELRVPTGLASLIIATVPLWMMLERWVWEGARPSGLALVGLALGFAGLVILVGPSLTGSAHGVDLTGLTVILLGAVAWATGSVLSRHVDLPKVTLQATGMEMLCGGALLLVTSLLSGEHAVSFSREAVLAVGYLVVFGSLIGFTAYVWLLSVAPPAAVSTYAFVNPVVAMILGSLFLHEAMSPRMLLAAAITLVGVGFITAASARSTDRVVLETAEVAE